MKIPPQRPTFELSQAALDDFDALLAGRQIEVKRRAEEVRRDLVAGTTVITLIEGRLVFRGKEFDFVVDQIGGAKAPIPRPNHHYLHVGEFTLEGLDADRLCLAGELELALPQSTPWDAAAETEFSKQKGRRDLVPMLSCGLILLLLAAFVGLAAYGAFKLFP